MSAVVERLRASKAKIEERERPEWTKFGREWAMQVAEYDQLKAVSALDLDDFYLDDEAAEALCKEIYTAVNGEKPGRSELFDFIRQYFGQEFGPSGQQLSWYLRGVKEVWDEVSPQL